jgi:hypothetical protein
VPPMASIAAFCASSVQLCVRRTRRCYETGTERAKANLVKRVEIPPLRFGHCVPFAPVGMTGVGALRSICDQTAFSFVLHGETQSRELIHRHRQ